MQYSSQYTRVALPLGVPLLSLHSHRTVSLKITALACNSSCFASPPLLERGSCRPIWRDDARRHRVSVACAQPDSGADILGLCTACRARYSAALANAGFGALREACAPPRHTPLSALAAARLHLVAGSPAIAVRLAPVFHVGERDLTPPAFAPQAPRFVARDRQRRKPYTYAGAAASGESGIAFRNKKRCGIARTPSNAHPSRRSRGI